MKDGVISPVWNKTEESIDLTVAETDFADLGLYEILHGDGQMLMAILGCNRCEEREPDVGQMPASQVERPWFVGKMKQDPALIRLQCEYLRWFMLQSSGEGKMPPCMRLRQLIGAQSIHGLNIVPEGSIVSVWEKE